MLPSPGRFGGQQHRTFGGVDELAQIARFVPSALARHDVRKPAAPEIDAMPGSIALRVHAELRIGGQRGQQLCFGEVQRRRLRQRPLDVVAKRFVAAAQAADEPFGALKTTVVEHDCRRLRQVVEQCRRALEEKRQIALDAWMRDAVAHVLVHLAAAHVHIEGVVPALAKASDTTGVEGNLLGGQDPDRVYALHGTLRIRIECSQAVDLVVVEVDPQRQLGPHGEDVHQRTAHGVLAAFGDGADTTVSGTLQPYALGLDGEAAAGFEHQRLRLDEGCRRQPLHQGLYRRHQNAVLHAGQGVERGEPLRDDVLMRGEVVVRQRFPVGERERFGRAGGKESDFPPRPVRVLGVARDVQHETVGLGDEARHHQARSAAEQALPVVRRPRRGNVDVRRVHGEIRAGLGQGLNPYSIRCGKSPKPRIWDWRAECPLAGSGARAVRLEAGPAKS